MNIFRNCLWLYVSVSFMLSYLLFLFFSGLFDLDKKMIFGLSGVLIAGAWSFLNIETNKEIRRKEEFVKFFNEYEEVLMFFVHEVNMYLKIYRNLNIFLELKEESEREIGEISIEGDREVTKRIMIEEHIANFLNGKDSELLTELIDQEIRIKHYFRLYSLKGDVVRVFDGNKESVDLIESLGCHLLEVLNKETSLANISSGNLYKINEDITCVTLRHVLKKMAVKKALSFEDRSGVYVDNKNLALFFITLGVFLTLWSVLI